MTEKLEHDGDRPSPAAAGPDRASLAAERELRAAESRNAALAERIERYERERRELLSRLRRLLASLGG